LLTAKTIGPRGLLPGAMAGAVGFTALITVGTGLVTHQLKKASTTYGCSGRSSAPWPSGRCAVIDDLLVPGRAGNQLSPAGNYGMTRRACRATRLRAPH
jgi:hypothetical protein